MYTYVQNVFCVNTCRLTRFHRDTAHEPSHIQYFPIFVPNPVKSYIYIYML